MDSRIYLDYAATAPLLPQAKDAMDAFFAVGMPNIGVQANANSLHSDGRDAFAAMEEARKTIANILDVRPHELVFTSGATESDNAALFGVVSALALQHKGSLPHVVSSTIEHDAVFKTLQQLEKLGLCDLSLVKPTREGFIELDAIKQVLRPETKLVSIIAAHNEFGAINDIEAIGNHLSKQGIYFHIDAVQALGKINLKLGKMPVDLASFSAHKIGGPKGIGLLYVKSSTRLAPLLSGGGQESGLRSGTQNVCGMAGFAAACRLCCDPTQLEEEGARLRVLRDMLYEKLCAYPKVHATISCEKGSRAFLPHIVNVCVEGIESETLILQCDMNGIAVSGGSACSTHSLKPSRSLLELGISPDLALGSLRISMGLGTTTEEIRSFLSVFDSIVSRLS